MICRAGPGWAQMPRLGLGLVGLRLTKTGAGPWSRDSGWAQAGLGFKPGLQSEDELCSYTMARTKTPSLSDQAREAYLLHGLR